jgi:hypothetical protein
VGEGAAAGGGRDGRLRRAQLGADRGLDPLDQLGAHLREGAEAHGFPDHVEGAEAQGLEGMGRAVVGERADDDDGQRVLLHDDLQEGEAVHPGHLQVQGQDVRAQLHDAVAGREGVGGGADDLDAGIGLEGVGQDLADHGGVIDHQDADGRSGHKGMGQAARR